MATVGFNNDGTYTSFSGADAVATFNGKVIGELQAVTINVQREKGPIYVMGSANPISFSRGKRGVAGNLVFVVFDRDGLLAEMEIVAQQSGDIPQYTAAGNLSLNPGNTPTPVTTAGIYTGLPLNNLGSSIDSLSSIVQFSNATQAQANNANSGFVQLHGQQAGEFWSYEDQIPPFDIVITLANEYGNAAYFTIHQAEILNNGMGISIDDINIEQAATFVALGVERVRPGFSTQGQANTSSPIGQSTQPVGGTTAPSSTGLV